MSSNASSCQQLRGSLIITAHGASNLRDTQIVGKQDPYVTVHIHNETFKGKPHPDGGRNATWEQAFLFNLVGHPDQDILHIRVLNKEVLKDTVIGRVDINLMDLIKKGAGKQNYTLFDPSNFAQIAGQIEISAEFKGTGYTPAGSAPAPVQQPAPVQVQQPTPVQQPVYQPAPVQVQQPVYQPVQVQPSPVQVHVQPIPTPAPAPAPVVQLPDPREVSLETEHKTYISIDEHGKVSAKPLSSDGKWLLRYYTSDTVSLHSRSHGVYLKAEADHTFKSYHECGPWEKFHLIQRPNGKFAFKTAHGEHLKALPDGGVEQTTYCDIWESFTVAPYVPPVEMGKLPPSGSVVIIVSHHNTVFSYTQKGNVQSNTNVTENEKFLVTHHDTRFSLRCVRSGWYVSHNNDKLTLRWGLAQPTDTELFTALPAKDSKLGIKAANGLHAQIRDDGGVGLTQYFDVWEQFTFRVMEPDVVPEDNTIVGIQTDAGHWVTCSHDGKLTCEQKMSEAAKWSVENNGSKVHFRNVRTSGAYLAARPDNSPILVNWGVAGPWESFSLVQVGHGKVALKGISGAHVHVSDQQTLLQQPALTNRESFTLVPTVVELSRPFDGAVVYITTHHKTQIGATPDKQFKFSEYKQEWERFTIESHGARVAFRSFHGDYITAHGDKRVTLESVSVVQEQQLFVLINCEADQYALRSSHGFHVQANDQGQMAQAIYFDIWEKFRFSPA